MQTINQNTDSSDETNYLVSQILRYFSFWPWILVSVVFFTLSGFVYLRYVNFEYISTSKIEILDKAQDREMALPTSMTVFNRSMINLENEMGVINSHSLHSRVSRSIKSYITYYSIGNLKTSENHKDEWFKDYNLEFKDDPLNLSGMSFQLTTNDVSGFTIEVFKEDSFIKKYDFKNNSTFESTHDLPFDLVLNLYEKNVEKKLSISTIASTATYFQNRVNVESDQKGSDQLVLKIRHTNKLIAEEYLNKLVYEFNQDGIADRQLEYKRTMDFVDSRSSFLKSELEKIENRKQNFKKNNKLSDLQSDASNAVREQLNYNNELFLTESQKDLSLILEESIKTNNYNYLPVNIGLDNNTINDIIVQFNSMVKERELYYGVAGPNNSVIKNIETQLDNLLENILASIKNYQSELSVKTTKLLEKEGEYADLFSKIPENEKILRSIERELNVKESLFLLLLQKREEAAINFAVVKPSIKIIDSSMTSASAVSPNKKVVILGSISIGFLLPIIIIFLWLSLDNKVHTKEQLSELLKNKIPIIGEIPHISEAKDLSDLSKSNSRSPLAESIRMIIANLKYMRSIEKKNFALVTLVTSSVKGEGKTLISSNISSLLSSFMNKKVLLIGADLRNPQIHQILKINKDEYKGLSDIIYTDKIKNYKDYIVKNDNLDIILSGTIPPNPTELLISNQFKNLIELAKKEYDHIIIDSAPCLLVSDTLEISKYADITLYVFRANHTLKNLTNFITECQVQQKLKNINLVLNSVGNSKSYGYKYGYQYGYQYGYKYGYAYNYGYGYGYSNDEGN